MISKRTRKEYERRMEIIKFSRTINTFGASPDFLQNTNTKSVSGID